MRFPNVNRIAIIRSSRNFEPCADCYDLTFADVILDFGAGAHKAICMAHLSVAERKLGTDAPIAR